MYSHFILFLLLVSTIGLINARTFYSIHRQYPFSDDNQEFTVAHPNLRRLENLFEYSKLWNDAQDNSTPYEITKKRAKAIIKGDPREFMG